MSNQHYFDVPFAFSGDVTAIPDPLQTGGTVSFTEGWNYNYQRDLATDPAALPIDRSTMNWLLLQITTALQQLQGGTVPEFILASQNGGTAYPYGAQAEVLWSASGNAPFTKYVNISGGTNSNTPSASDPTGATTGWQIACDPLSTSAQAAAGTNNASIMTPLLVAQQTALRALLAGSTSQVFNVGPATALTHAPQAAQVQQNAFNYGGAAGGTANALTAALTPAPTAYTDDLVVVVRVLSANTGATTLQVGSLAATAVVGAAHAALQGGELIAGGFACFAYSTNLSKFVLLWATGGAEQVGTATQSLHAAQLSQVLGKQQFFTSSGSFTVPAGVTQIFVTGVGGGAGGGGGGGNASSGAAAGGGGGGQGQATVKQAFTVAPGQVLTVTIGSNGNGNTGGTSSGTTGATGGGGTATTLTGSAPTVSLTLAGGSGGVGGSGAVGSGISPGGVGGASGSGTAGGMPGTGGWLAGGTLPGLGGQGGGTLWGQGGVPLGVTTGSGGGSGSGYGAGGAGGCGGSATAAGGGNGGNGTHGALLIEW